ncbi:MAG TPA: hypothetical protein VMF10_15355 [Candidatus Aquilonibacter sp.]|nr:hypothetical protein [Candidatus Aquilonibacter sp.]
MIKGIVGFLVIVAAALALFAIAPPLLTNYSFQDDLKTVAMIDGPNERKTDDDIRLDVLAKAREHDLQIRDTQITVQRIGTPGLAAVYVAADYSITVSLPGYSFDMHFSPNSGNKGF